MGVVQRILIKALVALVLLEVVLQAGSIALYLLRPHRAPAPVAQEGTSILFVGDSFTYGDGASRPENSYPSVVGRALRERFGREVRIVNQGRQGQNSRDVLLRLPAQLERARPDIVCVLIGANDGWTSPALVAEGELGDDRDPEGYVWRWRTLRLGRWLFSSTGSWQATGPADAVDPSAAQVADVAEPDARDLEIVERLLARAGIERRPAAEIEAPAVDPDAREARRRTYELIAADDVRAVAVAEAAFEAHPRDTALGLACVRALLEAGRRDAASAVADRIETAYRARPSPFGAEKYVQALVQCGRWSDVSEFCRRATEQDPGFYPGWNALGRVAFRDDEDLAFGAFARYLEIAPAAHVGTWRVVAPLTDLSRLCVRRGEIDRAILLAAAAGLVTHDINRPVLALRAIGPGCRPTLVSLADELGISEQGRARWRKLADLSFPPEADSYAAVLREHLVRIARLTRAAGAQPVFVSYPFFEEAVERVQREASDAAGVSLVAVRPRFDQELLTREREELFAADGHCNDAGYAIIGELVAAEIAKLMQR